jgi:hypothetical protein
MSFRVAAHLFERLAAIPFAKAEGPKALKDVYGHLGLVGCRRRSAVAAAVRMPKEPAGQCIALDAQAPLVRSGVVDAA